MMKRLTIYLCPVRWHVKFGGWFISRLILLLRLVLLICLVIGWMGWIRILKLAFVSAYALFYGQFGIVEMMLCLTKRILDNFCRLFIVLPTGSTSGHVFFQRASEGVWLLDALGWWRSFGLSSTRVDGGTLVDYRVCSLAFSSFRWSAVTILGVAWVVILILKCSETLQ